MLPDARNKGEYKGESGAGARVTAKQMFGTADLNMELTALQRLEKCFSIQPKKKFPAEYSVVQDVTPIYAEYDGRKCIFKITLTPFYCSARDVLASWGATSILDMTTLLSMVTLRSMSPEHWFVAPPTDKKYVKGERLMNFMGVTRSLGITYTRPAFVGSKCIVETQMISLSKTQAVIRADLRFADPEEGADAAGRGQGKVICSAVHDVASVAKAMAAMGVL